ncbi:MAG: universal stress protein [Acidobacteria bacterium]|nr:MAG: universal stress protein [Acidobacteriota bacterium]
MMAVKNILVATDFGPAADSAIEYGAELARTLGATLHLVHVVGDREQPEQAWQVLDAAVAAMKPVAVTPIVLNSSKTAAALLHYADTAHIDLIIAGTHGSLGLRDALDFFMGSVAQNLVRNAPCPVMTMRGPAAAAA